MSEMIEKLSENIPEPPAEVNTIESTTEIIENDEKSTFKIPLALKPSKRIEEKSTTANIEEKSKKLIGPSLPVASKDKICEKNVGPAYKEPNWSGKTDKSYKFEIIKNGVIVDTIDLNTKSFYVVGRSNLCDVVLEHPSVSRFHAVVQCRVTADEDEGRTEGFYVYDMESTHGTTLNKQALTPRVYYKLHVGFNVKFGGSTRMFILQGPDEDQEPESELSVTEIKELRKKQEEQLARLENEEENKDENDEGIDWGMGEDAQDEEEDEEITENPFAVNTHAPNEELYIDDPKKTLRGWFEREGYELEYQVEEKGYSQFCVRIRLPLENEYSEPMIAEVTIKGKKKEAVAACALEACRILDRQGLLRQANHESRKRKLKNWEENDFYDSDEDTFLDRTGTIEKKRQQRIQKAGKEQRVVETYDSLKSKLDDVSKEIERLDSAIKTSQNLDNMADTSGDNLDAYMTSICNNKNYLDKSSRAASKLRLLQLRKELIRLTQLVQIAKPTHLPELEIQRPQTEDELNAKRKKPLPMIGSMKSRGIKTRLAPQIPQIIRKVDPVPYIDPLILETERISKPNESQILDEEEVPEPTQIEEKEQIPHEDPISPKEENSKPNKHKSRRKKFKSELNYVYDATNPDYALWMPPDNQTGDGRTSLNDKYGY